MKVTIEGGGLNIKLEKGDEDIQEVLNENYHEFEDRILSKYQNTPIGSDGVRTQAETSARNAINDFVKEIKEREIRGKDYYKNHNACPKCGSDESGFNLMVQGETYRNTNKVSCACGWTGIVDNLIRKKE